MNNEPNKPIPAQELTEKELEGIAGGWKGLKDDPLDDPLIEVADDNKFDFIV